MERRFRWNLRQVLAAIAETERAMEEPGRRGARARDHEEFVAARLGTLGAFVAAVDAGIGGFTQRKSFAPETMLAAVPRIGSRR